MRSKRMPIAAAAALAALILASVPAYAEAPPRNANIWSGMAHQPQRADTDVAERKAGEADRADQRRRDAAVDSIARDLEEIEKRYPPGFLQQTPR